MKLTKDQRAELESKLSLPWGSVRLICDGREITLQVRREKALSYRVITFIDGFFKYEWCDVKAGHPESRFLRKSVRQLYSAKDKAAFEKVFGKRAAKADKHLNATFTMLHPDWSSGKAVINHLCKVCESVEVVEADK